MIYGVTEQSYLQTATWLNRIRHQEGTTGATTLRASVVREGKKLCEEFERTTAAILRREGFDETGQPLLSTPAWTQEAAMIPPEQVAEMLDACDLEADERGEITQNPVRDEHPAETVNVSIDDVVVKQQKRPRTSPDDEGDTVEEVTGRTYVHQTVAHLQQQGQTYCIPGQGAPTVLRIVLACSIGGGCVFDSSSLSMDKKPCTRRSYGRFHGSQIAV